MPIQVFGASAVVTMLNVAFNNSAPSNLIFTSQLTAANDANAFAAEFGKAFASLTNAQLASRVLGNLGLLPSPNLEIALADYFEASRDRGQAVYQLATLLASIEGSVDPALATYVPAAHAFNDKVTSAYQYSADTSHTTAWNLSNTTQQSANQTVVGTVGVDIITTGSGNDVVQAGAGADQINTGAGNDLIAVVGQTAAGTYLQSDISNPGGSAIDLSAVLTLANVGARVTSDVAAGEKIDGGTGTNRLVAYGNVDLSVATLANITQIQVLGSTTIGAQQLNQLAPATVFGAGEAVLNITNAGGTAITVDLSGMTVNSFRSLNIAAGVTLIADQADIADLHYITGEGSLKASTTSSKLNLAGKHVSVTVQDKAGVADSTHGGGTYVAGKVLIGGAAGDTLTGGSLADRIEGNAGDDSLMGGDGNDVLRGGAGVDTMDGGAGNDTFVIVGDISGGGKVDSAADTAALGFLLSSLNGKDLNEDADGAVEIIRGGAGDDTLCVYGTADLSKYDISGIEHIEIRSNVTFSEAFFDKLLTAGKVSLTGDGSSVVRIEGGTPADPMVLDLTQANSVTLAQIGQISLGDNVVLKVASLAQLGGARILTGSGTIQATSGSITLPSTYSLQSSLTVKNANGSSATGSAEVLAQVVIGTKGSPVSGTDGNDYLVGTDSDDLFDGKNGNDVFSGKKGNDTYAISGTGKKTIIDSAEKTDIDTLDLSKAQGAANVNLTDGGTVGTATTIQLGSGSNTGATQQDAPDINLMFIIDVSGSMGGTRITQVKQAAIDLLNAYDNFGDIAVRIVTFQSSATSTFNQFNGWIDVATAKNIINGISASGGTNYVAAVDTATQAFSIGIGSIYFERGTNFSYFLSDGEPSPGISSTGQINWENFLIQNQIKSNAIGFGGLNSTAALEPLAFDGSKVKLPTDSHAPGEIPASITIDTSKLGTDLIAAAKLDFVENLIGTAQADVLTGNSLNNKIEGGNGNDVLTGLGGNDTLVGGSGDRDVAVFRGKYGNGTNGEYEIKKVAAGIEIRDKVAGRDGVDIIQSIELLRFSDSFSDKAIVDIFPKTPGITESTPLLELAKFSDAAYKDSKSLQFLQDEGWSFIDPIYPSVSPASPWLEYSNAGAIVAVKGSSLVVSFRGTDDIKTDALDWVYQSRHYANFSKLLESVKTYIENSSNGIKELYVTGHSLGGVMATWYLTDNNLGGNYFESKNVKIFGASFEAPELLDFTVGSRGLKSTIPYYRIEVGKDLVPDIVQIVENGISAAIKNGVDVFALGPAVDKLMSKLTGSTIEPIGISNIPIGGSVSQLIDDLTGFTQTLSNVDYLGESPGVQLNLQTTFNALGYLGAISDRHSEYLEAVQALNDIGFIDVMNYVSKVWNIFGNSKDSFHGEVYSDVDMYDLISLQLNSGGGGVTITGDNSSIYNAIIDAKNATLAIAGYIPFLNNTPQFKISKFLNDLVGGGEREWLGAEKFTENVVILGTGGSDILIGDASYSIVGSDDAFFPGAGNDLIYGDQRTDDDGGQDMVFYPDWNTTYHLNPNYWISGLYYDAKDDPGSTYDNRCVLIADGFGLDKLWGIEKIYLNVDFVNGDKLDLSALDAKNNTGIVSVDVINDAFVFRRFSTIDFGDGAFNLAEDMKGVLTFNDTYGELYCYLDSDTVADFTIVLPLGFSTVSIEKLISDGLIIV